MPLNLQMWSMLPKHSLDRKKICQSCGCWWWSLTVMEDDELICEKCERDGITLNPIEEPEPIPRPSWATDNDIFLPPGQLDWDDDDNPFQDDGA